MTTDDMIPAATLIAMREPPSAPPELLMLRRHADLAFAGDAWVFPGGRVDPDDVHLAQRIGGAAMDDLAARIAAIRETIEEAGLAVALDPLPDVATLASVRHGLAAHEPFSALLAAHGLRLRPEMLLAYARWSPPGHVRRRFDTRFYLAKIDAEAPISADGSESIDICWTSAAAMLERWNEGAAKMLFPTRANLARLGRHDTFADAARDAASMPVRLIQTVAAPCEEGILLSIPEGLGYPPFTSIERHHR